jgi:inhibitor of cysteine peptidase
MDLGDVDAGQRRGATIGEEIWVRLAENPSTGFRWTEPEYDHDVLEYLGSTYEASGARPGAAGSRALRFRAVASGETPIRLASVRPTVPDSPGSTRFEVTIDVSPAT